MLQNTFWQKSDSLNKMKRKLFWKYFKSCGADVNVNRLFTTMDDAEA
jgi:hypothetical protein